MPIYIRSGLRWEDAEIAALKGFLAEVDRPGLESLVLLDEPIADVYGAHWSTVGEDVPGAESADEAVYLPGRNLLLTVKAAVWCRLRGVHTLALGSLASNPFPDSTPAFFADLEAPAQPGDGGSSAADPAVRGAAQGRGPGVGRHLPLHLTFSCIDPIEGRHCGRCNKCAERKKGFRDAGMKRPDGLSRLNRHAPAAHTAGPGGRPEEDCPTAMFRVTREIAFCYGHRLLNYDGKCRHLHGHNGRAVITLEGPDLDPRGMLVDFCGYQAARSSTGSTRTSITTCCSAARIRCCRSSAIAASASS